jgi:hypothetical protein
VEPIEERSGRRLSRLRLVLLLAGLAAFSGVALWYDHPESYWVEVLRIPPQSDSVCVIGSAMASLDVPDVGGKVLCGTYVEAGNDVDLASLSKGQLLLIQVEEVTVGSEQRSRIMGVPYPERTLIPEWLHRVP